MKKIILCIIVVLVLFAISIPLYKKISQEISWKNFEKQVVKFYNGDKSIYDDTFDETAYKWLKYAKSEAPKEYEINDMVSDYINCVLKAVDYKLNNKKESFTAYYKNYGMDIVGIHGIRDNFIEYIANNISDDDIDNYNKGDFKNKLINKLEKVLIHKSVNELDGWYILNDKDKRIEMPYNVYYDFRHNGKILKNEVKEISSIKMSKTRPCICNIEYIDNNGNINSVEMTMITIGYNSTDKVHYALPSLRELFYINDTNPDLTAGQHDYDEAYEEYLNNNDFTPLPSSDDISAWEKELEKIEAEKKRVFEEESRKYSK